MTDTNTTAPNPETARLAALDRAAVTDDLRITTDDLLRVVEAVEAASRTLAGIADAGQRQQPVHARVDGDLVVGDGGFGFDEPAGDHATHVRERDRL